MYIRGLQAACYKNSKDHGFWDEAFNFAEKIALIHSEASEALEEYRKGMGTTKMYYNEEGFGDKPEGIPIELADICIRVFDLCGGLGIDLEEAIYLKMKYNKNRPHKHGKKI